MSSYLAIDPGPTKSAFVLWKDERIFFSGIVTNETLLHGIWAKQTGVHANSCAIEMIASYGMAVGREVFETCVWIGRYYEAWSGANGSRPLLIPRLAVKVHHCCSAKAKDSNIRQALIDRFGAPGTKRAPGVTYGLKADTWQAMALAVYAADTEAARRNGAVA